MTAALFSLLLTAAVISLFIAITSSGAIAEDIGKKDYWINKYGLSEENTYTERALNVFSRVLAAADRRAGIEPALYIINLDRPPWAQSLADGSVILSRKGLELCYRHQSPEDGDSRMAFVIGHELAHQFNGDFWHYRFVRTAEDDSEGIKAFQDIKELAKNPDMLLAKELQADQYGIVYSTLAGFDSTLILSKDKNFFLEWAEKETPSGAVSEGLRFLAAKRAKAVSMRLSEVAERIVLFDMGVISFHLGRYDHALALFQRYASYFPGREVYANIGTIYLQLAYSKFRSARTPDSFPFVLSFGIEKRTRAETINISSKGFTETRYREYNDLLRVAVGNLKKAVEYDPFYLEAKNNLGCAYIIDNRHYDAVSILEEALTLAPDSTRVQNNLSVAYIMLGQSVESQGLIHKAEKMLLSARKHDQKAARNFISLKQMYQDFDTQPSSSSLYDDSRQDMTITMDAATELKTGMSLMPDESHHVIEEISGTDGNTLQILETAGNTVFVLTSDSTVRLILHKEASNMKINIKGGEKKTVYISVKGRNGAVLSQNRSPDYFEF